MLIMQSGIKLKDMMFMESTNPAGTKGFDFLEFTTNDFETLDTQFRQMGLTPYAKHKKYDVTIYKQNDVLFIIDVDKATLAKKFANEHGPSTSAMGFLVDDANKAYEHAIKNGAKPCENQVSKELYSAHSIQGVGGSLIYFIDYKNGKPTYHDNFVKLDSYEDNKKIGLTYIDHVTHNLFRGNMDKWAKFYENIFNFKEIRYFDIEGKLTGLKSRAMTSPCGKIRIPLNESSDDKSQIEEFLKDFHGEGIQHIALGTDNIYKSVNLLINEGLEFLDTPDTYYELINKRLPGNGENLELLQQMKILIDGTTKDEVKTLLQIFTKNMLGPVFFEVIQRKGDEGFGEGNFKALFESIELDQIRRGVVS